MLERLRNFLAPYDLKQRSSPLDPSASYPDIDAQLWARQQANAYRPTPTVNEALGIPAVMRAVTLLATTAAALILREYVGQTELDPPSAVVRRPAKAWTFGNFVRDTVFYMATRGEAIWLTMARDAEGRPADLLPVAPESYKSDWDGVRHDWYTQQGGKRQPVNPADVTHITLLRDPATGRGLGPLQRCGLALTVAAEADRWAARFFAGGGMPSVFLSSAAPIDATEAQTIKQQWLTDPPNMPKVGYGMTATPMAFDAAAAQLTESRRMSRGEVALMFGVTGRLLEYAESGTSLTYANVGDLATELVRLTLAPYYLEQIEQAFSDLLARGHEVRFDLSGFERADVKTRYEVYEKAIALGIMSPEYVAQLEGITGGSPEVRPLPLREVG